MIKFKEWGKNELVIGNYRLEVSENVVGVLALRYVILIRVYSS